MATRRRGADLSDLKSRLNRLSKDDEEVEGGGEAAGEAVEGAEPDTPAPPSPEEGQGDEAAPAAPAPAPVVVAATPSAPRPKASAPPADPLGGEDFADAVSDAERAVPVSNEPDEPLPSVEGDRSRLLGLLVAVGLAASIALVLGYLTSTVFESRRIVNSQVAEAGVVLANVSTASNALIALHNDLSDMPLERGFTTDFQAALEETFGDQRPVLRATLLGGARTLMAYHEGISRDLLEMTFQTQILGAMVDRHLRLTRRDADEIQRELAGAADTRSHAIVFDFLEQLGNVNSLRSAEDSDEASFTPRAGIAVSYEALSLQGEDGNFTYRVRFRDGQERDVPVHDLVTLNRDMLLEATTSETALSRWRQRAEEIRQHLEGIVASQQRLRPSLEELANQPRLFTL